jgi:hypothetical protein
LHEKSDAHPILYPISRPTRIEIVVKLKISGIVKLRETHYFCRRPGNRESDGKSDGKTDATKLCV